MCQVERIHAKGLKTQFQKEVAPGQKRSNLFCGTRASDSGGWNQLQLKGGGIGE